MIHQSIYHLHNLPASCYKNPTIPHVKTSRILSLLQAPYTLKTFSPLQPLMNNFSSNPSLSFHIPSWQLVLFPTSEVPAVVSLHTLYATHHAWPSYVYSIPRNKKIQYHLSTNNASVYTLLSPTCPLSQPGPAPCAQDPPNIKENHPLPFTNRPAQHLVPIKMAFLYPQPYPPLSLLIITSQPNPLTPNATLPTLQENPLHTCSDQTNFFYPINPTPRPKTPLESIHNHTKPINCTLQRYPLLLPRTSLLETKTDRQSSPLYLRKIWPQNTRTHQYSLFQQLTIII
jgi:hypothetical protein